MSNYSFFVEKTGNQFFLRRSDGTSYIYTNAPTNNPSLPENIMICGGFVDDTLTNNGLLIELQVQTNSTCCSGIQYSVNNTNNWAPLSGTFVDFDSSTYGLITDCGPCSNDIGGRAASFDGKEFFMGTASEYIVSDSGNDSYERWNYFPTAYNGHAFEYRRYNFDQTRQFEQVTATVSCNDLIDPRWRVDFAQDCYVYDGSSPFNIDGTQNLQTGYLDCSKPRGGAIDVTQVSGYPLQYNPSANPNPCSPAGQPRFTVRFPEAETNYTLHPTCFSGEPSGCDNRIVRAAVPGPVLSPNNIRATGLYMRIGGSGTGCTEQSNIIQISVPPIPPPTQLIPVTDPEICLPSGSNLYGYTAKVSYNPSGIGLPTCGAHHACNRALFDLFINNNLIGEVNLNNANNGGARNSTFTITDNIVASTGLTITLTCKSPGGICHNGIARVELIDMQNNTVFAACLPNDTINARIICDDVANSGGYPCVASGVFTSQPTDQVLLQQDGATATFSVGINSNIPMNTTPLNLTGGLWSIGYVINSGTPWASTFWQPLSYAYGKESFTPLISATQSHQPSVTITYRASDKWPQGPYPNDPGVYGYYKSFPEFNIYDALFQYIVWPSGSNQGCTSNIVKLTRG